MIALKAASLTPPLLNHSKASHQSCHFSQAQQWLEMKTCPALELKSLRFVGMIALEADRFTHLRDFNEAQTGLMAN